MTPIQIPLMLERFSPESKELEVLKEALSYRKATEQLITEERYLDAMERTVAALKVMREFPDYENVEFRSVLVALLFDLSEIHFALKTTSKVKRNSTRCLRCSTISSSSTKRDSENSIFSPWSFQRESCARARRLLSFS